MDKEEINELEGSFEEITSNVSGKQKTKHTNVIERLKVQDSMVDCVQNDQFVWVGGGRGCSNGRKKWNRMGGV